MFSTITFIMLLYYTLYYIIHYNALWFETFVLPTINLFTEDWWNANSFSFMLINYWALSNIWPADLNYLISSSQSCSNSRSYIYLWFPKNKYNKFKTYTMYWFINKNVISLFLIIIVCAFIQSVKRAYNVLSKSEVWFTKLL